MANLEKLQFYSVLSRFTAVGVGILQSMVVLRLLSLDEFGIVQIALAVGGSLGIYQHLGLASGTTREIAASNNKNEIFKIFFTSLVIRYAITLPLAVGLYYFSTYIAFNLYDNPAILTPIKIFSLVLLVQGVQSISNAVISGTKRFYTLFIFQIGIAIISLPIYIFFVYMYGINGFFYALLLHNLIWTLLQLLVALIPLHLSYNLPNWVEFKELFKRLFSISASVYIVKILYSQWEKIGTLILGLYIAPASVAVFAAGLLYAKKLTHVSDAITDVNLPYLTSKYVENISDFKSTFSKNFNFVFAFILLATISSIYWSKELVLILAGQKYMASLPYILPLVFTYLFISLINIFKSSIYIPAKMIKHMIITFALLLGFTVAIYYILYLLLNYDAILSMVIALVSGVLLSLIYIYIATYSKFKIKLLTHEHVLLLIQALVISYLGVILVTVTSKIISFALLIFLYFIALYICKFVTKKDVFKFIGKSS